MKSTEMLKQIKTLLNIEVKLEEQKLENGTRVEAESFEKGKEIFILTDDQKVAMPVGEYLLEDGRLVVIEEEGLIADVREVSDEAPEKEEAEEDVKDETEDLEEDDEAAVEDWAGMEKRIKNLEDAISDLKSKVGEKDMKEDEVEMEQEEVSRQPKSRTIKEEFNEEIKEEVNEDLKEELSKPAASPIRHNPEGKSSVKQNFKISPKRRPSTMDLILNQITK
jgi:chromosome segregation ATPase